jgi:type IV pilus assembly protein PilO
MNLEDFKDASLLPNTAKFGAMAFAFVAALGLGYMFDTSDQLTQLEELRAQELQLRASWVDKKKQAVNLDAHKKQLVEIEVAFGTLLRQLPNKSEMGALLNDVNQAGLGQGLSFDLFRPAASETLTEFYAEQPVAITVSGSYHSMGAFAEDVSKLSRIVNLGEMNIRSAAEPAAIAKGASPKLVMDATVRTYRYLDDKDKAKKK